MDAFDRKNRPPPNPLEGLESPFLDQEIFAGQGEEEWEPRLGALEAASPFLSTFELSGAGSPPSGARREEEPPFPEPEAETEVERLFEAEGGITGEEDDRREVRDTTIAPYRWICSVTYEKDGKTLGGGSGFLISNRHVLTAAHVISDKATAPTAHSVYVYPGGGGASVELPDGTKLPAPQDAAGSDGQPVIFGTRPEHLSLAEGGGIPTQVVVVEPTGADTFVSCRHHGSELSVVFRERHAFAPGHTIQLLPDPARAHLFDAQSGRRLAA